MKPMMIVEMDGEELALRIAEAAIGVRRPDNKTATDVLNNLNEIDKGMGDRFRASAVRAMQFFRDAFEQGQRPQ